MLQGLDTYFSALKGRDALGGCARSGQRCNRWDTRIHRCATNSFFIEPGLQTRWRVDDEVDTLALDKIDHVGAALFHLVDAIDAHPRPFHDVGCTRSRDQLESHINEAPGEFCNVRLVVI